MSHGTTSVIGKVYDGVRPATVLWTVQAEAGGCALSTPRAPFCPGGCGSSAACVDDGVCAPYPASQNVGTVRLTGLATSAGEELVLTSVANTYQPPAGTTISYPGFAEGDELELRASGGDTGAFRLVARGVGELALRDADTLALAQGAALSLAWTGATDPAASAVHVELDISHHGGSRGMIECEVADTGALAIDAALVDRLLALGVAGFPTIIVTRSSVGHTNAGAGHVDLVVASKLEVPIAIPGLESCTEDSECTPPATCQPDLTCK
ncbi:MAG: hypothetical protein KF773_10435 [Deltaproteobacteria bacterium]|nr:hypothetical protein [Deltaproteobacteria bacterium]